MNGSDVRLSGTPRRCQTPPSGPTRVPIMHARASGRLIGFCLTDQPVGYLCHWSEAHTLPCLGASGCPGCKANLPLKWVAYAPCANTRSLKVFIVAIPEHAYAGCPELGPDKPSIRGRVLTVARPNPAVSYRVTCEVSQVILPADRLPSAPNVDDALLRLWERFGPSFPKGGDE